MKKEENKRFGDKNPMKNEEVRIKHKLAIQNKDPSYKKKISDKLKGRVKSEEHKKNISESKKRLNK